MYDTVYFICIRWFEMSATQKERGLQNEKFLPIAGLEPITSISHSLDWRSNRLCCRNFWRLTCIGKQKQKYRGIFETQKSRNKTSSGDIGLNIRTLASPKVGQDQVSEGVSVLCWHAAPNDIHITYYKFKHVQPKTRNNIILNFIS